MTRYVYEVLEVHPYILTADDLETAAKLAKSIISRTETLRSVKSEKDWNDDATARTATFNPDARPPKKVA